MGGMAEIYRGKAIAGGGFEKPVAIKRILPHLSQDKRFVELLTTTDASDPAVEEAMRLEHVTRWLPATDDGWARVIDAVRAGDLEGATFV